MIKTIKPTKTMTDYESYCEGCEYRYLYEIHEHGEVYTPSKTSPYMVDIEHTITYCCAKKNECAYLYKKFTEIHGVGVL